MDSLTTDLIVLNIDNEHLFQSINKHVEESILTFSKRHIFVHIYGWSLPSIESAHALTSYISTSKVLEVGCGRGLWGLILKNMGVDIVCTSLGLVHGYASESIKSCNKTWTDVEILDCVDAINKYSDRDCLFISWGSGILHQSLAKFKGTKLIVIGEGRDGCTDGLSKDNSFGFKIFQTIDIPVWSGIHDKIRIYERI